MNQSWIFPVSEYYARLNSYVLEYGLPFSLAECRNREEECALLGEILGQAGGRAVLDASCGWGRQALALARLGWKVTAADISETSLDIARQFAREEGLALELAVADMRCLPTSFIDRFDWVISCFALYEIAEDEGILQALMGIHTALRPGGRCYLRLRDMDFLMEERPRHIFKGEKRLLDGRILCIEDWDYESEDQVVALTAFLREDGKRDPCDHFRWVTETIGCRKKVLRKEALRRMLLVAGFSTVCFLPQPHPWDVLQVVAGV